VAWMLNFAICLVCLVKLFVYGEPIVAESEMHEYYVYKKKADQFMAEVWKVFHVEIKNARKIEYSTNSENNIYRFRLLN
jgi:hypothetical protein